MSSFKAYGKVDEAEQAKLEAARKTRKRITIISLSSITLVAIVVAAVVGTRSSSGSNKGSDAQPLSTSVKAVCVVTLYPDSCFASLSPLSKSTNIQPLDVFKLAIHVAMNEVSNAALKLSEPGFLNGFTDNMTTIAMENCQEHLSLALDDLNSTLYAGSDSFLQVVDDLITWLSSAGTCQQTCIDGFENANQTSIQTTIADHLKNSTELTSNSLAITTWLSNILGSVKLRRLMSYPENQEEPEWLHPNDRRLLQSPDLRYQANIVVGKDASCEYKKITDALKQVPKKSEKRFVIYVKKGVYYENVLVDKNMWNVVMVGDGSTATIVSGYLNFVDGTPTFATATFAVYGKGFVARDIGFRTMQGQSSSKQWPSCQSQTYQSFTGVTLMHFKSHFMHIPTDSSSANATFMEQLISSLEILQLCFKSAKYLLRFQYQAIRTLNTITAQGKLDPNQDTGISIQGCTISPFGNLSSVQTCLGRPWKNYSTTVFLQNNLGSLINPNGWLPWVGTSAPSTIFYSEYQNYGPGSSTKNRVKWKGVKTINLQVASKFIVNKFIQGNKWISASGAPYQPGL